MIDCTGSQVALSKPLLEAVLLLGTGQEGGRVHMTSTVVITLGSRKSSAPVSVTRTVYSVYLVTV